MSTLAVIGPRMAVTRVEWIITRWPSVWWATLATIYLGKIWCRQPSSWFSVELRRRWLRLIISFTDTEIRCAPNVQVMHSTMWCEPGIATCPVLSALTPVRTLERAPRLKGALLCLLGTLINQFGNLIKKNKNLNRIWTGESSLNFSRFNHLLITSSSNHLRTRRDEV